MAASTQERALEFAQKCEQRGKLVRRIIVDGKRYEVEFETDNVAESGPSPHEIDWKP